MDQSELKRREDECDTNIIEMHSLLKTSTDDDQTGQTRPEQQSVVRASTILLKRQDKQSENYEYINDDIPMSDITCQVSDKIKRPGSTIDQKNKEYYGKISVFIFVGFCLTAIWVLLTLVLCKESVYNK